MHFSLIEPESDEFIASLIPDIASFEQPENSAVFIAALTQADKYSVYLEIFKAMMRSRMEDVSATLTDYGFQISANGIEVVIASPLDRIYALAGRLPSRVLATKKVFELRAAPHIDRAMDALETGCESCWHIHYNKPEQIRKRAQELIADNESLGLKSMYYHGSFNAPYVYGNEGWKKDNPTTVGTSKLTDL